MFCPVCKAEYRAGFQKCSDCGIELVPSLPPEEPARSYSMLWQGEDAIFHDTLVTKLESASLEYADTPFDVYARKRLDAFGRGFGPRFGFVISVPADDLPEARGILEKLLDIEPNALPYEIHRTAEDSSQDLVNELPLDWDQSAATVELFSGNLEKQVSFLEDALREIGIPSRRIVRDDSTFCVMVRPEDEPRAIVIRDQIAEQAEPTEIPPRKPSLWEEEPVRSYALLYYLLFPYLIIAITVLAGTGSGGPVSDFLAVFGGIFAFVSAVAQLGSYWMMYQSIRYEIRPLRFFLLAFLPLSFIWYYFERYTNRRGAARLPIAIRARMQRPPA